MIEVECTYFKESGKWYATDSATFAPDLFKGCLYPKDYGKRLRELRRLPGLQSGSWNEGAFTVKIKPVTLYLGRPQYPAVGEWSYPELVLPE